MYGYIYKITNLINGKIYIGKTTTTVERRFQRHIKHALNPEAKHKNLYLYNAMRKYGVENFKVEQIDTATTIGALNEKEQYWIAFYHSFIDDPLCNGYNMTIGGDGGCLSQESAAKAQQTKIKNGTNRHSEATKLKMSIAAKGRPKSILHKKHLSEHHRLKASHILIFEDGHVEGTDLSIDKMRALFSKIFSIILITCCSFAALCNIKNTEVLGSSEIVAIMPAPMKLEDFIEVKKKRKKTGGK